MAYQRTFKPGRDFSWVVSPFLPRLPKTPWDDPLVLEYPAQYETSCKWQWYNWMHHTCKGMYKITISPLGPVTQFIIKLARAEGRITTYVPKLKEESLETDDITRQIEEAMRKDKRDAETERD